VAVPDPRPTLEAPDDDPYLWLEEIETPRVLAWVEAQSAATLQRFSDAAVMADRDILKAIFDRPDNIATPNRRAGRLFNPWKDAANPRGVWRVTTLESFCRDAPDWDVLAHPGYARKMAAKLQAMGYQAYFYELATGGHSYGKDHADTAAFMSLGYAFLPRAIGWNPD
jgi:prolyl oligopeptidase PreP (S9A serine peptidase family)